MIGPRDDHTKWSKSEKKTNIIWYHLYVESKKKLFKWIYIQNRNRLIDIKNKLWLPKGEGGDKLGVWNEHIHSAT